MGPPAFATVAVPFVSNMPSRMGWSQILPPRKRLEYAKVAIARFIRNISGQRHSHGRAGIHIAVAEDDPSDLMQLEMILEQIGLDYTLTVALDGEEARDFILKRGRYRGFRQRKSSSWTCTCPN
jgi:hypothetical protein